MAKTEQQSNTPKKQKNTPTKEQAKAKPATPAPAKQKQPKIPTPFPKKVKNDPEVKKPMAPPLPKPKKEAAKTAETKKPAEKPAEKQATPKPKKTPAKAPSKEEEKIIAKDDDEDVNNNVETTLTFSEETEKQEGKQEDSEDDDEVLPDVPAPKADKKRKREDSESSKEPPAKKQKKGISVTMSNLSESVSAGVIEETLKKMKLPFLSIERTKPNYAVAYVETEADADQYIKVKTAKMNDVVVVFNKSTPTLDKTTLIIGNLVNEITADSLRKYVGELGQIQDIVIFSPNGKTPFTIAAVKFDKELKDEALEFNGAEIMGQSCTVKFLTEDHLKVLVLGVDKSMSEDELKEFMEEAGPVGYVYRVQFKEGPRGSVIVCYKTIEACRNSLNYDGADMYGKPVRIFYAASNAYNDKEFQQFKPMQKRPKAKKTKTNPNAPPKPKNQQTQKPEKKQQKDEQQKEKQPKEKQPKDEAAEKPEEKSEKKPEQKKDNKPKKQNNKKPKKQ